MRRSAILLLATLPLAGCLGDNGHRIQVRRTPEEIARANRQPKDYAELIDELKAEEEANALDGELRRSEAWSKVKKLRIGEITQVPEDPWESFEDERRETLYRKWPDRLLDPPVVAEGEGEGEAKKKDEEKPAEGEGEKGAGDFQED
ncbi:MAG: hypothetical protein AB7N76_35255 [Planctomycetota bacterium]